MNSLYSKTDIELLNAKKKKSLIIVIALMATATIINVVLCFFASEDNKTLMEVLTSIIYVLFGWVALYLLLESVIESGKRIKYLNKLEKSEKIQISGVIESIKGPTTISSSMRVNEVMIINGREHRCLYLDITKDNNLFKPGDEISAMVSNNIICEYEVNKHEE